MLNSFTNINGATSEIKDGDKWYPKAPKRVFYSFNKVEMSKSLKTFPEGGAIEF